MKKKMKTFSKKEKHFGEIFVAEGVSFTKLKIDFRKIFVKASSSQNLKNVVFDQFFNQFFRTKRVVTFDTLI